MPIFSGFQVGVLILPHFQCYPQETNNNFMLQEEQRAHHLFYLSLLYCFGPLLLFFCVISLRALIMWQPLHKSTEKRFKKSTVMHSKVLLLLTFTGDSHFCSTLDQTQEVQSVYHCK